MPTATAHLQPLLVSALAGRDAVAVSSSRAPSAASTERGACVLRPSERGSFELRARPNDAVSGTVGARAFVVRGDDVQPWDGVPEVSEKGAIRLLDENRKLMGATELRIVVGREHLSPATARDHARGATSGRAWQVLRCSVDDRSR